MEICELACGKWGRCVERAREILQRAGGFFGQYFILYYILYFRSKKSKKSKNKH